MMLQQSRKGKRALLIAALACTTIGIILLQSQHLASAQKKVPVPVQHSGTVDRVADTKIYNTVEEMPVPPVDLAKYLVENIKYPASALKDSISGRVVAKFVIGSDGKMRHIEIVKPLCDDCAKEVLRVLQTIPVWKPGRQNGKPVNVYYTLPVAFKLIG